MTRTCFWTWPGVSFLIHTYISPLPSLKLICGICTNSVWWVIWTNRIDVGPNNLIFRQVQNPEIVPFDTVYSISGAIYNNNMAFYELLSQVVLDHSHYVLSHIIQIPCPVECVTLWHIWWHVNIRTDPYVHLKSEILHLHLLILKLARAVDISQKHFQGTLCPLASTIFTVNMTFWHQTQISHPKNSADNNV